MLGIRKKWCNLYSYKKREEERWKLKKAPQIPLRHLGLCADAD